MKNPVISLIMPAYNIEQYVPYAIKSIISQTFANWELIIINDGSIDDTGRICEYYSQKDSRITVFQTENQGVSAARNIGLNFAKGEYIAFIDGDDIYDPMALEILLKDIMSDNKIILAGAKLKKISSYHWQKKKPQGNQNTFSAAEYLKKLLRGTIEVSCCAKLFIREKIGNLRFIEGKNANEDKYFLFQYLLQNKGMVIIREDSLYGYYSREGSATKSVFNRSCLDTLYFSDLIINDIRKKLPEYYNDAEYQDFVRRLEILKNIIRTGKYKQEIGIFVEVKEELLRRYAGRPKDFYGHYISEYRVLKISNLLYLFCVRLFDLAKHKSI